MKIIVLCLVVGSFLISCSTGVESEINAEQKVLIDKNNESINMMIQQMDILQKQIVIHQSLIKQLGNKIEAEHK